MKTSRCFLLLCLVLFIFACASDPKRGILITGTKYPPWYGDVEVFFETPNIAFEKVGIVSTQGSTKLPLTDLVSILQNTAAGIGANGIIVQHPTTTTKGAMSGRAEVLKSKLHLMATAIRIK